MTPEQQRAIDAAIAHLETYGWAQGKFGNKKSPTCLVGAFEVTMSDAEWTATWRSIKKEIASKLGQGPITWNDTPGRTKDEVLALLRSL